MVTRLALVFLASQVVGTFSLPISEPQVAQEPFTLFAWGNGIPGLPLLYADGSAVFADFETASKSDNMVPLTFSLLKAPPASPSLSTGYLFTATPDQSTPIQNAATLSPPFSSASLCVPSSTSTSRLAGFVAPASSSSPSPPSLAASAVRMDGFVLSETVVRRIDAKGAVQPNAWCAFKVDGTDAWQLEWNVGPERTGGVPVTLRTLKYPAGAAPPRNEEGRCRTL